MLEIYTDGASRGNPGEAAISFIFVKNNKIIYVSSEYIGIATNNLAEYLAIIKSLEEAKKRESKSVKLYSDSLLAISQINGKYKIKSKDLLPLYEKIKNLINDFENLIFEHISRESKYTKIADYMCTLILGPK
ncbi:MAG: ribonuclease H [Caldisericum exile]|uniref:Ribonuclease H n=1 Tax=Caldisericum exile TaxID=693075 RepID=A0A2J6X5M1_9BACT|nr:MAG: ribonuclease H [Caldisericum exile]